MRSAQIRLPVLFTVLYLHQLAHSLENGLAYNTTRGYSVTIGDLCQLGQPSHPYADSEKYVDCVKQDANREDWPWVDKGKWMLRKCDSGKKFNTALRVCQPEAVFKTKKKSYVTAQYYVSCSPQVSCPCTQTICICPYTQIVRLSPCSQGTQSCGYSSPIYMPNSCTGILPFNNMIPRAGQMCNPLFSPMVANPYNVNSYFYCIPSANSCGTWTPGYCPPNSVYNSLNNLCGYPNTNYYQRRNPFQKVPSNNCRQNTIYGQCNRKNQCPGTSSCTPVQTHYPGRPYQRNAGFPGANQAPNRRPQQQPHGGGRMITRYVCCYPLERVPKRGFTLLM
ncbi:unnamed protein product [Soboliphyme baturini]|uniref:Chitin-binding type-2 domain-containing protein n=1 Tax=Soboliphyme baturini TaxID=241478 RepID=A0A183IWZ7_9BILA|nr:unnamed protein product [Soboliphyme baturini]